MLLLRNGIFSHETMSPKEGYSADIERALKYIALNYQQPLTLEEVAGYCNPEPHLFFPQVQADHRADVQRA